MNANLIESIATSALNTVSYMGDMGDEKNVNPSLLQLWKSVELDPEQDSFEDLVHTIIDCLVSNTERFYISSSYNPEYQTYDYYDDIVWLPTASKEFMDVYGTFSGLAIAGTITLVHADPRCLNVKGVKKSKTAGRQTVPAVVIEYEVTK